MERNRRLTSLFTGVPELVETGNVKVPRAWNNLRTMAHLHEIRDTVQGGLLVSHGTATRVRIVSPIPGSWLHLRIHVILLSITIYLDSQRFSKGTISSRGRTKINTNALENKLRRVHGVNWRRLFMVPSISSMTHTTSCCTHEEYRLLQRELLHSAFDDARL